MLTNSINQSQVSPLNNLLNAGINPVPATPTQATEIKLQEELAQEVKKQDQANISFDAAGMKEAHTLSEDRVARLLGLI